MTFFFSLEDHRRVLAAGTDVPEQKPAFALDLPEVGISGKTVWVRLAEAEGERLPCAARVTVDLPGFRRGIHMSRIEAAIAALHDRQFASLGDYAALLAAAVLDGQQSRCCRVEVEGKLSTLQQTPVSARLSVDTVGIAGQARLERRADNTLARTVATSAAIHHLTACPCTQVYNEELFHLPDCPAPLATHSQRSVTRLCLGTESDQPPAHLELVRCLAAALHPVHDLLKRPDEADLVLRAHKRPQFAEDAVRDTARAAALQFAPHLPGHTEVTIESLSLESIHIHDVTCRLTTTLGELVALLEGCATP